jgi:hypothetical protein
MAKSSYRSDVTSFRKSYVNLTLVITLAVSSHVDLCDKLLSVSGNTTICIKMTNVLFKRY